MKNQLKPEHVATAKPLVSETSLGTVAEVDFSSAIAPALPKVAGHLVDRQLDLIQRQLLASQIGNRCGNGCLRRQLKANREIGQPQLQRQAGKEEGWRKVPAHLIGLEFVPDEKIGDDGEPLGVIHFRVRGQEVMRVDARGGRPMSGSVLDPNAPGRTFGATTAGIFKLATGNSHVSRGYGKVEPWIFSQLEWGTPIRDGDKRGGVLYQTRDGRWASTTSLRKPISREDILARIQELHGVTDSKDEPTVPTTWNLNDFGQTAFHIQGAKGEFIHTTPENEAQFAKGLEEKLEFSHGCIHIKPSDRKRLVDLGLLRGGVKVVIRSYRPETIGTDSH